MRWIPYLLTLLVVVGSVVLLRQSTQQTTAKTEYTPSPPSDTHRTFYVDHEKGDDRNPGLTEARPWKSLAAIRRATLKPGDHILLRRGQVWRESLTLEQSGAEGMPIVIGAYGTGDRPALRGSDTFDDPAQWHEDGDNRWYLIGMADNPGMVLHDGNFGVRRATLDALAKPWDFFHDAARKRLYVYSTKNPALEATSIEIPVREFVIGPLTQKHLELRDLDLGHGHTMTLLAWDSDHLRITRCNFVGSPGNHIQFQQGSNFGVVSDCTFDDWNLRDGRAYAIQVIEKESGPVDIMDCTFTATRRGGGEDHTAIMNDYNGWIRTVRGCRFVGNGGALADEGVVIWRPSATADAVVIEGNTFTGLGGTAIMVQELEHYGAKPRVEILRNRIENVCLGDDRDKEALRVRQFSAASSVLIAYNLIDGTAPGTHPHPGIGVQEAKGLRIANNLIRSADVGIALTRDIDGVFLRNNLVVENRGEALRVSVTVHGVDSDYNALYGNGDTGTTGHRPGKHTLLSDPRLKDDFSLLPDSPCLNAGVKISGLNTDLNGNPVPQGAAPEIGVLERLE